MDGVNRVLDQVIQVFVVGIVLAPVVLYFLLLVRLLLLFGEPVFAVRLALARGVQWLQPGLFEFGAGGLMARVLNWVAALRNRTSRTFYSRRLLVAD
jgi:hypothetical protein